MNEQTGLAERFETHRPHLRGVAYRMLGSLSEADDAVQEAWVRASRADTSDVENLRAWLTTVVARVCLNTLRSRQRRREDPIDTQLPDPIVSRADALDPEQNVLVADSVGLALLVVLETLTPAERLAFVLHDVFAVPFEEIAPMVDRTPAAARQLASRARRRVQDADATPDADVSRQREVVDAFFAAARGGDLDALVAVLDPDVVVRTDRGKGAVGAVQGAEAVAGQAITYARLDTELRPALVNGAAGVVVMLDDQPFSVMAFTVRNGRVVEIDAFVGAERLRDVDLSDVR